MFCSCIPAVRLLIEVSLRSRFLMDLKLGLFFFFTDISTMDFALSLLYVATVN